MAFETVSRINLHDTDAAGVVFFVSYFRIAHTGYEEFLESIGWGLGGIIGKSDVPVLIAHAEADYLKPFRLGEKIKIRLSVTSLRKASFELLTEIVDAEGVVGAVVRTVHVAVDGKSGKKIRLPEKLRAGLETIS